MSIETDVRLAASTLLNVSLPPIDRLAAHIRRWPTGANIWADHVRFTVATFYLGLALTAIDALAPVPAAVRRDITRLTVGGFGRWWRKKHPRYPRSDDQVAWGIQDVGDQRFVLRATTEVDRPTQQQVCQRLFNRLGVRAVSEDEAWHFQMSLFEGAACARPSSPSWTRSMTGSARSRPAT